MKDSYGLTPAEDKPVEKVTPPDERQEELFNEDVAARYEERQRDRDVRYNDDGSKKSWQRVSPEDWLAPAKYRDQGEINETFAQWRSRVINEGARGPHYVAYTPPPEFKEDVEDLGNVRPTRGTFGRPK